MKNYSHPMESPKLKKRKSKGENDPGGVPWQLANLRLGDLLSFNIAGLIKVYIPQVGETGPNIKTLVILYVCREAELDEIQIVSLLDCPQASVDVEFAVNVFDMGTDGIGGNKKIGSNFRNRLAGCQKDQNIHFALGEGVC